MLIKKTADIPSLEITPRSGYEWYMNRRKFLLGAASRVVAAGSAALGAERVAEVFAPRVDVRAAAQAETKLDTVKSPLSTTGEDLTSLNDITHYNNFYEFGVNKDDPAKNAGALPTRPWTVKVDGKVIWKCEHHHETEGVQQHRERQHAQPIEVEQLPGGELGAGGLHPPDVVARVRDEAQVGALVAPPLRLAALARASLCRWRHRAFRSRMWARTTRAKSSPRSS